ncbi:hypothetical protein BJY24_003050 [Nocardia transvalensis]|uniref:DUF5753 domain-containing protein n=1 Tax=Nocardia transvalensis TaxID=37333 RepID=A0A7W9PEH3_9NOCA|nr:helix-turn-helix transcriptional regulator [Nocardia transvalensis]MBB5914183.1 hypothetical protein [Nocardia transvalensis]
MASTSPTVASWELMLRIVNRADERGLKAGAIPKALDVSQQYWSKLTRGRGVRGTLSEDKLTTLLNLLEFDADEQAELLALRDVAKGRNPYAEYSALFSEQLMRFYGLEAGAQSIRSFENSVVSGLLQTEDYIRALMKAIVTTGRPTEVEQRVSARLQRQRLLDGPEPLQLSIVMGEAALMHQVGGPQVHRGQLRHLVELIERHPGTLDVRVIPYEAGAAIAGLNSATFHLLDFESGRLPTVGWVESAAYGEIIDTPKRVNDMDYLYKQVRSIALDQKESADLIGRLGRQKLR